MLYDSSVFYVYFIIFISECFHMCMSIILSNSFVPFFYFSAVYFCILITFLFECFPIYVYVIVLNSCIYRSSIILTLKFE